MPEFVASLDRRDLAKFRMLASASRTMAAKSLTFTAERAQEDWVKGHSIFKRRNNWIDKGVRKRAATASNLTATVGTIDRYMGRHVTGVDDPKRPARSRLFVPAYQGIGNVGTHTRIRTAIRRAAASKTKPFVARFGSGKVALVRRAGKGRTPLKVLGTLEHAVDINARLDVRTIVARAVEREFSSIYERLLIKWAAGS